MIIDHINIYFIEFECFQFFLLCKALLLINSMCNLECHLIGGRMPYFLCTMFGFFFVHVRFLSTLYLSIHFDIYLKHNFKSNSNPLQCIQCGVDGASLRTYIYKYFASTKVVCTGVCKYNEVMSNGTHHGEHVAIDHHNRTVHSYFCDWRLSIEQTCDVCHLF
eukprot:819725_1